MNAINDVPTEPILDDSQSEKTMPAAIRVPGLWYYQDEIPVADFHLVAGELHADDSDSDSNDQPEISRKDEPANES